MTTLQIVVNRVFEERNWSWALVGLIFLIAALGIRNLLIADILKRVRQTNKKWYRRTQKHYGLRSLSGWLCFMVSATGIMGYWRFQEFFEQYMGMVSWILIFVGFYIASLILHQRAYMASIVEAIADQNIADLTK